MKSPSIEVPLLLQVLILVITLDVYQYQIKAIEKIVIEVNVDAK